MLSEGQSIQSRSVSPGTLAVGKAFKPASFQYYGYMELTAVFLKVPEGYVGFVEELPGANTQGDTLEEARENLREAVALVIEANRVLAAESVEGGEVIREKMIMPAA
jgi:predicted RNase H-like HicB family nuclease